MRRIVSIALAVLAAGCVPDLDARESLVAGPRVLAMRGDPPEARPGEEVTFTALVVTPEGTEGDAGVDWALCAAPKPLTENDAVSAACLGDAVRPLGSTTSILTIPLPSDACALFGPDTPPGEYRPRDPDVTGGFYQPVRARALGVTAFGLERLGCNLPNAPLDVATEYQARYAANRNPSLHPVIARVDGDVVERDRLPAGREVLFEAGWSDGDVETYPVFDPASQVLVDRREALRVSWFATAGTFEHDVTGRAEDEMATTVSNRWTAPARGGHAFLWLVLRDSRGGVDFVTYELAFTPDG